MLHMVPHHHCAQRGGHGTFSGTPLSSSRILPNGALKACSPRHRSRLPFTCCARHSSRRETLLLLHAGVLIPPALLFPAASSQAAGLKCPGVTGYALRKCFKELREQNQDGAVDVEDEKMKMRQYEQPGDLITLPTGIQYREMENGAGPAAQLGSICEMNYIVYRLASGAYFKYSSGGTPVLLFALGYGFEGQDDLGSVYRFRLGDPGALPAAATAAMVGMQAGGRRRILVPPRLGWINDKVGPIPDTFGGRRRLASHNDEPLLLEVQLVRVYAPDAGDGFLTAQAPAEGSAQGQPFQLPTPPSPFKNLLGQGT